ncbi:hypothetical protein [Nitrosomonas mobilis]|uniref:Uncharacterized protein n=1 Tax=Nitrosomonas mobilis TaxID=51642 RepID=A0A1G5SJX6_9PROT|nr:hypothetical protein [Nitrosomonas mobilis]SCZ86841.1 conserved hypothetical protein [Nitrosomonas mobilis]HNO74041.1 hypothetical protein [Nitrosomonas mobilis]
MTDSDAEQIADPDEDGLLVKLDEVLLRYQHENRSLVQKLQPSSDGNHATQEEVVSKQQSPFLSPAESDEIPLLIEKVELTTSNWPVETGISELLCFAFDHAIREAQIKLDPLARITLLQALAKRLPKNF